MKVKNIYFDEQWQKNSLSIHLIWFIIQVFGIVESKSDNGILRFNIADQKLKIELFSKFWSAILDPPSRILKFCFLIWIQHPQKSKDLKIFIKYNNFRTFDLPYWIRHFEFWNSAIGFGFRIIQIHKKYFRIFMFIKKTITFHFLIRHIRFAILNFEIRFSHLDSTTRRTLGYPFL